MLTCELRKKGNFFFQHSVIIINIFLLIVFSLKTTLLKWRPDYEVAADEYNQAGIFKNQ